MIQSYLDTPTLLLSNSSPVSFERDCIRTRSANPCNGWLCHNEGSPLYKITKGGNYKVSFNANITSGTVGQIAFALFMDNVEIPGSRVITEVTTAGVYSNVAFTKVVPVCCCGSGTLTIQSVPNIISGIPGATTTVVTQIPALESANIIIEKLP